MDIPASIRAHARKWGQWEGWRRHAPAVGSVAFHIAAGGLVALSLGATLEDVPAPERQKPPPMMVDFVQLELPEPEPELEVVPEPPQLRPRVVEEFVPEPVEVEPEPPPVEPPEPDPPKPEPPKIAPPPPPEPIRIEPPKQETLQTSRPTLAPPLPDAVRPEPAPPEPPRLEPQASVTPPPRATPQPNPQPAPSRPEPPRPAPRVVDPRKKDAPVAAPAPALTIAPAPTPAPSDDAGGVYLPPSALVAPGGGPAGLRNLAYGNPCESTFGKKSKDCVDDWRGRVGTMDSVMPRSKDDLKQHFAEHIAPCAHKVGCEGGEWISTNGTRAPPDSSPASGGASSLGGLHDSVGRLAQKPDFIDPGFGD